MAGIVIALRRQDRGVLPPPVEYETVLAWLAALPRRTLLNVTLGEGAFRCTVPALVEDIIDGLAMAPYVHAALRRALEDDE